MINNIFSRARATDLVKKTPKYDFETWDVFHLPFRTRYNMITEYHNDSHFDTDTESFQKAISIATGSDHHWTSVGSEGLRIGESLSKLIAANNRLLMGIVLGHKYSHGKGYAEYVDLNNVQLTTWMQMAPYQSTLNYPVTALSVVEEFQKKTNLQIRLNKALQYQLGFTTHPLEDLGWLPWFPRKKELETNLPSVYFYGFNVPDFTRNPIKSLCVHCNLVEGTMVGSEKVPLLRIIPANPFSHMASHETISMLQYKRVNKNHVSAIKIWFTEKPNGPPLVMTGLSFVKLKFIQDG